jgi:subtilisin family serine protease
MALEDFPGVEMIIRDIPVELIAPVDSEYPAITSDGPENGIRMVRAPEAWALGWDGSGRLVCNFDTGVNGNHEALISKYRGNNGGTPAECWFDPLTNTDYTVGVAPGAQWIAAGVVDRGGGFQRTVADILAAFQWAAEPDSDPSTTEDVPDVVNNSWGIPIGYYPACDETFWEAIDNLEAAGVVCIFAAGNEGPYGQTVRTPADRITSDFNSFAVGAIDANDSTYRVASFSSRGPSGCDHATIKPEITAPGVMIRSAARDGGYVSLSGTSMAAPHVAGAVAILRQYNPHSTPGEVKMALMNSAFDLGQTGEDNNYGWGVVDIMRALQLMPEATEVVEDTTPDTRAGITIYPNPFNTHTLINLPGSSNGELILIYDLRGRLVRKLEFDNSSSVIWDGADRYGRPVSSGIYFARTDVPHWRSIKMTLLK